MTRNLNRRSLRTEMLARVRMKALLKRSSRRKRIFDLLHTHQYNHCAKCIAFYDK